MPHEFSDKSAAVLSTCKKDIQTVFNEVIRISKVDFSNIYGVRADELQIALYAKGRTAPGSIVTNCDGIIKKSAHQEKVPGEGGGALDIAIYTADPKYKKEARYDEVHLAYIAGIVDAVVDKLLAEGKITHRMRWGGNWDGDGIIMLDQNLQDLCHWEEIDA